MQEDVNNEKESLEPRDIWPVAKKTWSKTAAAAGVLTMVEVMEKLLTTRKCWGMMQPRKELRSNIDVCTIQEVLFYSGAHGVVHSSDPSLLN